MFHRQDSPSALKSNSLPLSESVHWADQRANIANQTRSQSIVNQLFILIVRSDYIDENVLLLLSKRSKGVTATIFTTSISPQLHLDLQKHNAQYSPVNIEIFTRSHDRFLLLDEVTYHIGASLKDLGKKWFAFSKMEITSKELLEKI